MSKVIKIKSPYYNNYIIPVGDDYCLIDTGYYWEEEKFLEKLHDRGIPLENIKYIVITHMHSANVGFLKELLKKTNALLIYDTKNKLRLEAGKNNLNTYTSRFEYMVVSKLGGLFVEKAHCFPAVFYDNYVDSNEQPLKDYGITFFSLKGHTECDLCVAFEDNIYCGDICSNGIMGSHCAPTWILNKYELLDSWKALLEREESYICPSRGKPFLKTELSKAITFWKARGVFKLYPKK